MATEHPNDQHLNRAEILAALDYEIASIEKEQSSPGWTKWTFYGGFTTLIWVAISEFEKKNFTTVNAALVLLLSSVLMDFAEVFVVMLNPPSPRRTVTNRFTLASLDLGGSRLGLMGIGTRIGALLAVYYFLRGSSLKYISGWFVWFYSIILFVVICSLIQSCFRVPIRLRKGIPAWKMCVASCVFLFPLFMAAFQASTRVFVMRISFTASDFRIGLLGAALLWLLGISLVHVSRNQPLLETLRDVRRDLAFDRIAGDSALRQADIALDGMKVEDYLQTDLQKVLLHFDSASKSMHELQDRMREANALVESWEKSPPAAGEILPAPSKMLRAMLESCDLHRRNIGDALDAGKNAAAAYTKKKRFVKRLVAESDLAKIDTNIASYFERLKQQAVEIKAEDEPFRERLNRLGQKSPHLLPEPRVEKK
jgi:hypothetical protein